MNPAEEPFAMLSGKIDRMVANFEEYRLVHIATNPPDNRRKSPKSKQYPRSAIPKSPLTELHCASSTGNCQCSQCLGRATSSAGRQSILIESNRSSASNFMKIRQLAFGSTTAIRGHRWTSIFRHAHFQRSGISCKVARWIKMHFTPSVRASDSSTPLGPRSSRIPREKDLHQMVSSVDFQVSSP